MNCDKDVARDIMHDNVLTALDKSATNIFGCVGFNDRRGTNDDDLPALFKVLDAHLDVLAARFNSRQTD